MNQADGNTRLFHPMPTKPEMIPETHMQKTIVGGKAKRFTRESRQGFALVVVLTLMVLLTILALGLLTLASVSLRSTSIADADSVARANARLALQMAIGQLQAELGPDQRISAPGGQLLPATDISAHRHWIGVYDSWPSSQVSRPSPVFRKWLVSGSDSVVRDRNSVTNATSPAAETVELVSGSASSAPINAGLINIERGGYAWWVSDNNMKAKLGNLVTPPTTEEEAVAGLQSPSANSLFPIMGGSIARNDPRLDRLVSTGTLDLLATPPPSTPPPSLFHDAVTHADGLVTNVRSGGFRKDLSFFLEKPFADVSKLPLYTAGSTPGINFGEIWADYNVWGEIRKSGIPTHADGSNLPVNTPYLQGPTTRVPAYKDPFIKYKQLTRIQHTQAYSMISRPKPGALGEYDLFLVLDPIYTIWNPFNVAIYLPPGTTAAPTYTTIQNWGVPYRLKLRIQPSSGPPVNWEANVTSISATNFNMGRIGNVEKLVMRPGEVQVLSQSYLNSIQTGGTSLDAKLGWNFGSGFVFNLTKPGNVGGVTVPNSLNLPPIRGSDVISFSLAPAGGAQAHNLGLTHSRQYIGEETTGGGWDKAYPYIVGNFSIDWTSTQAARDGFMGANAAPQVFREIPFDPTNHSKQVSAMSAPSGSNGTSAKWPLFVYTMGFRTEEDPHFSQIASLLPNTPPPRYTGKSLLSMNPKSFTYDLGNLTPDWTRETPMQIGLRRLTSLNNVVDLHGPGLGYFGAGHTASTGNSYVITHSVPTAPLLSLGALQNSVADGVRDLPVINNDTTNYARVQYLRPSISHPIANSFAPSIMLPTQTETNRGAGKYNRDLADHSFLVNRALWDDYFFSSISPRTTTAYKDPTTAYQEQKDRLTAFLNNTSALPNKRFKPWTTDPARTILSLFPGSVPVPDAYTLVAASLLVDGAFNVNSTSVAAWRSVLAALRESEFPVRAPGSGPATLTPVTGTPVPALLVAGAGEIGNIPNSSEPLQWRGFRSLTDDQITELATAIVKQVRLRGPFTSLADFVNRRPGSDKTLAVSGALQSALDDPAVSINAAFRTGNRTLSVSEATTQGYQFPEAEAIAKSAGAPGYVKQGDLLTPMAPIISVRGDTFTVRTYGEARDNQNNVVARARCEAIVQRVPDYVDSADGAHVSPPVSPQNLQFGRRFKVVSFRYLTPEEI